MTNRWTKHLAYIAVATIIVVVGVKLYQWSQQYQESNGVHILAAHDIPALGLPVFAQFIVTQTLYIEHPFELTRLSFPVYVPEKSLPLRVKLFRYGRLVYAWTYTAHESDKTVEVILPVEPPILLDGDIKIEFNGRAILHEQQGQAMRIFTDSSDNSFPLGNYRIAENQKKGDIGLTLTRRDTNMDIWLAGWHRHPLGSLAQIFLFSALGLFALRLPFIFAESWADKNPETT